jgi:hypothetical protein
MLLALGEHHVRIVEMSERSKVRYAALSYCWGTKAPSIALHRGTIDQLRAGVPLERLDATIRDAVIVVRAVGLEYLWVDALCIFQDDTEGKAHEIAHMHEIYRNATFTLIASRAAAVQEGFLDKREPADPEEPRGGLQVRYLVDAGTTLDRDVRLYPSKREKLESWYQRAWTLQEVLLSGRLLQYSTTQTTWNCQYGQIQYRDCDGWLANQFNSYYYNYGTKELLDRATSIMRQPSATASISHSRQDIFKTWDDIVRAFSNRKLSHRRDRLPAISAIAREFARVLNDEYICGHWNSRLASDLLWYGTENDRSSSSQAKENPSWSWASYHGSLGLISKYVVEDADFYILRYRVVPETPEEPYGAINSASLTVRGLITPVPLSLVNEDLILYPNGESLIEDHHAGKKDRQSDLRDALLDQSSMWNNITTDDRCLADRLGNDTVLFRSANLHLLIIGFDNKPWLTTGIPSGLILSKQGLHTYTRVGFFQLTNIWGKNIDRKWLGRGAPKRPMREYRARLRYLWGGKKNIKVITII